MDEKQQAMATASVKADSLLINNWTWENAEGIWAVSAISMLLLEMLWLHKMLVNPLSINVGLKKRVGKSRIWSETLL